MADALLAAGLKPRIRLVASGKLVTGARAAWALGCGADFVNTARGFMFALGCIQALRCHANTCPTGVTTHNPRLQRGLVVEEKYLRVAHYATNMNKEIDMIAHSCGVRHARELERRHVRLVQPTGGSIALDVLYPAPGPERHAGLMTADALPSFAPRVDFVIGGVQKGGTTSLDRLLRTHPAVAMARDEGAALVRPGRAVRRRRPRSGALPRAWGDPLATAAVRRRDAVLRLVAGRDRADPRLPSRR